MTPGPAVRKSTLTWVEIDRAALVANHYAFRNRLGPTVEIAHAVKSNAYGHGLELIAKEDQACGVINRLAVISVEELVRVRQAGIKLPVLILGYVPESAWEEVINFEGTPVLASKQSLEALGRGVKEWGREVSVHLKVETGTHRYGLSSRQVLGLAEAIEDMPGVKLEGIATHFANIEDTTNHTFAAQQLQEFGDMLQVLSNAGKNIPVPHAACSAAAILFPDSHYGMARIGIASYGIWPSKETKVSAGHLKLDFDLKPVLSWKTRVAQINRVPSGRFVGYGCSWRAPVDSRLAVLPMGYADGFDRKLSNVGHVLIGGQRAPIRGRVCMNVTMVDITHIPQVNIEDEVVLIGTQEEDLISAEMMAEWVGTIPYEVLARIGPHLPRFPLSGH